MLSPYLKLSEQFSQKWQASAGSREVKLWFLLGRGGVVCWYGLEVVG